MFADGGRMDAFLLAREEGALEVVVLVESALEQPPCGGHIM